MDKEPAPENQKVWSNQIQNLRREYENTILQCPGAGGVFERIHLVLVDIPRLAGSTPSSIGESSQ
jgi:hypothetical protein